MAYRVRSEAELPPRVLEALRAQGAQLGATGEPSRGATVEGDTSRLEGPRDGWGARRGFTVALWGWVGAAVVLGALRGLLG